MDCKLRQLKIILHSKLFENNLVCAKKIFIKLFFQDSTVRQDSCWALSYLTDGPDTHIQLAYDNGVVPFMLKFLSHSKDALTAPALRVLGNFATGNDELTQVNVIKKNK